MNLQSIVVEEQGLELDLKTRTEAIKKYMAVADLPEKI